jgi:hypothetical protein
VGALGKVFLAFNPEVNPIREKMMALSPTTLTDITRNFQEDILGHLSVILEAILYTSDRCVLQRTLLKMRLRI